MTAHRHTEHVEGCHRCDLSHAELTEGLAVIGCVWGAHRRLVVRLGDAAPSYEWCEVEWGRLRKTAPAGNALPGWLESELFWAWRRETVTPRPCQLSMFEAAS